METVPERSVVIFGCQLELSIHRLVRVLICGNHDLQAILLKR